jgi:hypothetical protein
MRQDLYYPNAQKTSSHAKGVCYYFTLKDMNLIVSVQICTIQFLKHQALYS